MPRACRVKKPSRLSRRTLSEAGTSAAAARIGYVLFKDEVGCICYSLVCLESGETLLKSTSLGDIGAAIHELEALQQAS